MTIEEKAKRYDEVSQEVKDFFEGKQKMNSDVTKTLEHLFPELKESEDERARKELIDAVQGLWDDDALPMPLSVKRKNEWLAWLEKQGKKVNVIENFDTEFEKQVSHLLASIINKDCEYTEGFVKWASNSLLGYAKHEIEKQGEISPILSNFSNIGKNTWKPSDEQIKAIRLAMSFVTDDFGEHPTLSEVLMDLEEQLKNLKKQDEGKPALETANEPTDKIEPRFKVGDWVVANYSGKIGQVVAVSEDGYGYQLNDGLCFGVSWCDIFHLWSIKNDARDGDILASDGSVFIFQDEYMAGKPRAYCGIVDGGFYQGSGGCWTNEPCYPATKEQRDLLFQKMEEAGYKWDSENKKVQAIMKIRKYE